MRWTTTKPTKHEYYWAIYKDVDDLLDAAPEIVKVYYDGKTHVVRPGYSEYYKVEDFPLWGDSPVVMPEGDICTT